MNSTLEKFKNFTKEIENLKTELKSCFEKDLQNLLLKYKNLRPYSLKSIKMWINNHEFNDGDPTYFSLCYNNLMMVFEDGLGNELEIGEYNPKNLNKPLHKIRDEIVSWFEGYDVSNFYETVFADDHENIVFKLDKNNQLKY